MRKRCMVAPGILLAVNVGLALLGTPMRLDAASAGVPLPAVVESNAAFALVLLHELQPGQGNVLFSPYSVSMALTMTAEGARGSTAEEMGEVLCLPASARMRGAEAEMRPWDLTDIHKGLSTVSQKLKQIDGAEQATRQREIDRWKKSYKAAQATAERLQRQENWQAAQRNWTEAYRIGAKLNEALSGFDPSELRIANALWCERAYPFRDEYVSTIDSHYGTERVWPVDFIGDFKAARLRINRWAAVETRGRIDSVCADVPGGPSFPLPDPAPSDRLHPLPGTHDPARRGRGNASRQLTDTSSPLPQVPYERCLVRAMMWSCNSGLSNRNFCE